MKSLHPPCLRPTKMTVAIQKTDNRMELSPIDDADRGRVEEDTKGSRDRHTQCCAQHRFNRPNVRYQNDGLTWMHLYQVFDGGSYTAVHGVQALSTRRGQRRVAFPGMQGLGVLRATRLHFAPAQSLPGAKV